MSKQILSSSEAFSIVADFYDEKFSMLPHVRELRERIMNIVANAVIHGGRILDLGCGTGLDARHLAEKGFRVIAADPSNGMLRAAKRRCNGSSVSLLQIPETSLAPFREHAFDGILSNFGALNCVPDIARTLRDVHDMLRENGVFVLCLINRISLFEIVASLCVGKFSFAFRRLKASGVATVGSASIRLWYHRVHTVKRAAKGKFTVESQFGLNILTPPPSYERAYREHRSLMNHLARFERRIEKLPVISTLGDHVVMVLKKNPKGNHA